MAELEICYKDDDLVVVNKPRGMLVHPVKTPHPPEEIAMKVIRDQLGRKVYTVHRLDRPTSGLLLFALNVPAVRIMQARFEQRAVDKEYLAVVHGKVPEQWLCTDSLFKEETGEMQDASTEFESVFYSPVGSFECAPDLEISVVKASPHSGRYHQIRRHLANAGFPILGDYLYGDIEHNNSVAEQTGISRMMLMAQQLSFFHPITDKALTVKAPVNADFNFFIHKEGEIDDR